MADEEQASVLDEKALHSIKPEKIYVKDVSFETPNSPEIFTAKGDLKVSLLVDSSNKDLGDNVYEVVLTITITVNMDDQTAYLIEVHQAGIFTIIVPTPEDLHRRLNTFCLRLLHPYASAAITDLISRGGFPQFIVPPMNFGKRYKELYENTETTSEPEAS